MNNKKYIKEEIKHEKNESQEIKDKEILEEAYERFDYLVNLEAKNRELFIEDLKFANGDGDNGYQWDEATVRDRTDEGRPTLTVNKVKVFNRAITNDFLQNRTSPKVLPVANGADIETAKIFNDIIRHIEIQSCATNAYSTAFNFAVDAGIGFFRITTDFINDMSFDQEIYIKRIKNPLNVYLDSNIQYADGRDAKFGFVIEDLSEEEFEAQFGEAEETSSFNRNVKWNNDDETIKVCEYFRVVEEMDILYAMPDGSTILESNLNGEDVSGLKSRNVTTKKVEWYKIGNDKILEKKDWAGKYIPIVRVIGSEIEIDGELHRVGHTRALKDSQRMYNFWTSSAVEHVGLSGKQPYLAPYEAITGHEEIWNNLNVISTPYIPYNAFSDDGSHTALPPPTQQVAPQIPQAYLQGMQICSEEMQAVSGQYNAQMGQSVNDQSGIALGKLQSKGDKATYHFTSNFELAQMFTSVLLIDLIPKIYDTPRVIKIVSEDGKENDIELDPRAPGALNKLETPDGIKTIYNPSVGEYDVIPSTGPNYATARQEQVTMMTTILASNPNLWQSAGDLIVKALDFPMADELAERIKKTLPPELIRDDSTPPPIPPEVQQQLSDQEAIIKQLDATIVLMQEQLVSKKTEAQIKQEELNVNIFKAETDRIKVLNSSMSPEATKALIVQLMADVANHPPLDDNLVEPISPMPSIAPQAPQAPMQNQSEMMMPPPPPQPLQ